MEPNEATFGAAISACEGAQAELSTQTEKLRRGSLCGLIFSGQLCMPCSLQDGDQHQEWP